MPETIHIGLHLDVKNELYDVMKELVYLYKGKKGNVTYNDVVLFLIKEYKKISFLQDAINAKQKEEENRLKLIRDHIRKIGIQINGQKVQFDINDIPGVNTFVVDEDVEAIRKVKKRGDS